MIRHIVMWTFADDAHGRSRAANLAIAKRMLDELPAKLPGIRRFDVGIDELGGENAHLVLVSEFDDWAALDAYQEHPAHQEIAQFVAGVRTGRWAVDYSHSGAERVALDAPFLPQNAGA